MSQILLKNSFGKVVFQILHVTVFAKRQFIFFPPFLNGTFFRSFFFLIYGCFGCIHTWCKFRTEMPTGKYSKRGSKWTPSCAQKGVKSSLDTKVLRRTCTWAGPIEKKVTRNNVPLASVATLRILFFFRIRKRLKISVGYVNLKMYFWHFVAVTWKVLSWQK